MANRVSTSQKRIAELMDIFNITQSDIVKKTKISKSTLSNYLSGKRTPDQDHLSVIADPYGIDPSWLMGYDVPMIRKDIQTSLTDQEHDLILQYRAAPDEDKRMVERILKYASALKGDDNNES